VALEQVWLHSGLLSQSGDFLEFDEVRRVVEGSDFGFELNSSWWWRRRSQLEQDRQLEPVLLVYGSVSTSRKSQLLQGIVPFPRVSRQYASGARD